MTVQPFTAEDAVLLYAEAPGTQLQIGALCFFAGAPLRDRRGRLRLEALRTHVEADLAALPRFRQRIAPVIADVAVPMWVDDTDFDIRRHVKAVRLPSPGTPAELHVFMDRLLSEPMSIDHPLWDFHFVEGADLGGTGATDGDIVAVVVRAHHVMADGIALHAAAMLLLDAVPHPPERHRRQWVPAPTPSPLSLTVGAVAERLRRQAALAVDAAGALLDPRRVGSTAHLAAGVVSSVRRGGPTFAPALPFTGAAGRRRAFAWDTLPMADIVAVKHACGATVNDVVLAIAAGAVRRALEDDGSFAGAGSDPRAIVPVGSVESARSLGNRFSVATVALPVRVDDPLERVRIIHARMHEAPPSVAQSLMPRVFSIADVVPPALMRPLVPWILARQPLVNLAVSNIPGSREPLYLWESPMLGLHPFINVVGNVSLIVGVLSYVDSLGIGITVDPDVVGDPGVFADHVRAAADELVSRVR